MSIESSTTALRTRSRVSGGGGLPARQLSADQITIPGTGVEISRTQAAIGGAAVLLAALALATRGGRRRGFFISQA